jgi:hypothetical protein
MLVLASREISWGNAGVGGYTLFGLGTRVALGFVASQWNTTVRALLEWPGSHLGVVAKSVVFDHTSCWYPSSSYYNLESCS